MNKKRKTRSEKLNAPKHNFAKPIYRTENKEVDEVEIENKTAKNQIAKTTMKDIRNVAILIMSSVVLLGILAYLTYQTGIFNFLLSRLNIHY